MLSARIVFAFTAVLVLAGLWFAFRPQAAAPVAAKEVHEKMFDLLVKDGKLVSGPAALQVRQGEHVTLRIESNANDELHVHGYDLKMRIKAGEPAKLEFAASRSGRFELELHGKHRQLGALEVYPK